MSNAVSEVLTVRHGANQIFASHSHSGTRPPAKMRVDPTSWLLIEIWPLGGAVAFLVKPNVSGPPFRQTVVIRGRGLIFHQNRGDRTSRYHATFARGSQ